MALANAARSGDVPDLRHRAGRLLRERGSREHVQRHGPARHRAHRTRRRGRADAVVAAARPDGDQVPVNAPWQASNAALWEGYTLERWVEENSSKPRFQRARAARHPADLRRRAARAVAAVRAVLHRLLRQRAASRARSSATSTPAAARSSSGSSAARRRRAQGRPAARLARGAELARAPDRAGRAAA